MSLEIYFYSKVHKGIVRKSALEKEYGGAPIIGIDNEVKVWDFLSLNK